MTEHEDNIKRIEEQLNSLQQSAEDLKMQLDDEKKAAEKDKKKKKAKTDDDRFMFEQDEGNGFLDMKVTVKQILYALVTVLFVIGLVFLVKYGIGVTNQLKTDTGNVAVGDDVARVVEDADASENTADTTTDTAENDTETAATNSETDDDTASNDTVETNAEKKTLTSGVAGKFAIEFNGEGIATDESKDYGRVLMIKYKLINRKGEAVKPDYVEYSIKEGSYASSPKKVTLPSAMKNLPDNSEVTWTIDYKSDNAGASLGTYALESTKLSVTLTVRNAAGNSLATVTKEFSV